MRLILPTAVSAPLYINHNRIASVIKRNSPNPPHDTRLTLDNWSVCSHRMLEFFCSSFYFYTLELFKILKKGIFILYILYKYKIHAEKMQTECINIQGDIVMFFQLSVCMNTRISAIVHIIDTKFGRRIPVYHTQNNTYSNIYLPAQLPWKGQFSLTFRFFLLRFENSTFCFGKK